MPDSPLLLPQAIDVISSVQTEPCGNIRRINVEIPSLSVSDMRRLKATDKVRAILMQGRGHGELECCCPLSQHIGARLSRRIYLSGLCWTP